MIPTTLSIIDRLSFATKRSDKEQVLVDAFMRGHREFFIGAQLCYDPLQSFGVKKVAEILEEDDAPGTFLFSDFLILARNLQNRILVGDAAREAINEAAENCQTTIWNRFYRRILLNDLRCGVDATIINKVLKKLAPSENDAKIYFIPLFGCQLGKDGSILKGKKLVDIRLTGTRILSFLDKEAGTVIQFTKKGVVTEEYPEIKEKLLSLLTDLPGSLVLDGQIVSKTYIELVTSTGMKSTKLALFDIIPMSDFKRGGTNITQENRHAVLASLETTGILRKHAGDQIYVLPKVVFDLDSKQGQDAFEIYADEIKRLTVEKNGVKGIMIKEPDAPYVAKRSNYWIKLKV